LVEGDSISRDTLLASVELARCGIRLGRASVRELGGEQVAHHLRVVQIAIERLLRGHPHEAGGQELAVRSFEDEALDCFGILASRFIGELAFLNSLLAPSDVIRGRSDERRIVDLRDDDGLADEVADTTLIVAVFARFAGMRDDGLPNEIGSFLLHPRARNGDAVAPVVFGALVGDDSLNCVTETSR